MQRCKSDDDTLTINTTILQYKKYKYFWVHRVGCHKWTSDTVANVSEHLHLHVRFAKMIRTIAKQESTIAQYHVVVHYQVCRREDGQYNSSTSSREHAPTSPAAVALHFPPDTATIVRVLKYDRRAIIVHHGSAFEIITEGC